MIFSWAILTGSMIVIVSWAIEEQLSFLTAL